jgi:hypothetical protein
MKTIYNSRNLAYDRNTSKWKGGSWFRLVKAPALVAVSGAEKREMRDQQQADEVEVFGLIGGDLSAMHQAESEKTKRLGNRADNIFARCNFAALTFRKTDRSAL